MNRFKKLDVQKYKKTSKVVTPDSVYWKRLSVPTLVKEFGAIDYIDFSPIEPHYFAVTCSVRVQIYNPITKLVVKNLSRFQETAYGGTFRNDGRLLVAGDEQGLVKLFDTTSKNVLRLFKGHKAAVHRTCFTQDLLNIASFADDKTVKLWDIATEKAVHTYSEHNDYIRAGGTNPVASNVLISGGYDGKINLYDTRTDQVTHTVDHGAPVESLLFLPTGGIFLSAGGTEVCVWDMFAGCRLLTRLSQHHKTVTCLRLGSNGKRILSGGLDRHVKIYDVATYQPVHTLTYPNAVLSLGVSPNDQTVVAGMVDGLISISNMEPERSKEKSSTSRKVSGKMKHLTSVQVDHEVALTPIFKNPVYDDHLRKYEYVKCLDCVMKRSYTSRQPEITVSVIQELIRRKGLYRALAGRSHSSLIQVILFIIRYIGEQRFMRVLIDASMIFLDVYEDLCHEFSDEMHKHFQMLANTVKAEISLTHKLLELQGALELLTCAADAANEQEEAFQFVADEKSILKQSTLAKETFVLTV